MIPSGICPPEGYQPVLQEVGQGVFELINAYDGTYRYFGRELRNVEDLVCARARLIRRILRSVPNCGDRRD